MDQYFKSIISGEAAGILPATLRASLAAASIPYRAAVGLRNLAFDRSWKQTHKLPVPVISIGNITIGGTGKTPTVIMVCRDLLSLGKRPAILTRGYGGTPERPADEVLVLRQELASDDGGTPVIVNPNRVEGGNHAIQHHHADVLVMDDGFQHRRLHRDLNIVLVDATAPMGIPGVLPRGTWREPPSALKRADLIMLTRTEQVAPELVDLTAGLLTQWATPHNIFQQTTRVTGLYDSRGASVTAAGQRVIAFAGIGNPEGFLHTVRSLGLNVSAACWFDDHHNYHLPEDFTRLNTITTDRAAAGNPVVAWITTLKDQVKLPSVPSTPVPLWHVRIEARITSPSGMARDLWLDRLAQAANAARQPVETLIPKPADFLRGSSL